MKFATVIGRTLAALVLSGAGAWAAQVAEVKFDQQGLQTLHLKLGKLLLKIYPQLLKEDVKERP